jgi:hypothetical protein
MLSRYVQPSISRQIGARSRTDQPDEPPIFAFIVSGLNGLSRTEQCWARPASSTPAKLGHRRAAADVAALASKQCLVDDGEKGSLLQAGCAT